MPSIFTKIIQGEIPCHKILESDKYFAFLEIRPLRPGHTLVIPKERKAMLHQLSDESADGFKIPFQVLKVVQGPLDLMTATQGLQFFTTGCDGQGT